MLPSFLIALREGVEAALVVGIVLVYLNRTGRAALDALGVGRSLGRSGFPGLRPWPLPLERWQVSEDGFEGVLMLVAAALVVTMIIWMNRVARHCAKISNSASKPTPSARPAPPDWAWALCFPDGRHEGAELVLILRAVELSTAGVDVWIGTLLGIALAVAVGLFFFHGTLPIPLHRFFAATSTILMVVAFQLVLTGLHELSEAMWMPSSNPEMATSARSCATKFSSSLILAPPPSWSCANGSAASAHAERRDPRRAPPASNGNSARRAAGALPPDFVRAVVLTLTAEFVYTRSLTAPDEPRALWRKRSSHPACRRERLKPSISIPST